MASSGAPAKTDAASGAPAKAASTSVKSVIGESFVGHDKKEVAVSTIENSDLIGIYFSAHWCGPCRAFTPKLSTVFTELKTAGKSISLIFASRDRDEKTFHEYFATMSWGVAFPFGSSKVEELASKYQVSGIPTLVVLDKAGNLIAPEGDGDVQSKGAAAYDGWIAEKTAIATRPPPPPGLEGVIGSSFVDAALKPIEFKDVVADFTCLYFSAHWCPPCRAFTPTLSEFFTNAKAAGKSVSIIFCSRDSDEKAFKDYFGTMSFGRAMPYGDGRVQKLMQAWGIKGIPTLAVLNRDGKVIRANGRGDIQSKGIEAFSEWK